MVPFQTLSNFFFVERLFSILYYLPRRGFWTEGSDARKHWLLYSPLFLVWANFCALLSEIQNAAMDSLCEYALAKANDTCVKLNGLFRLKCRNMKDCWKYSKTLQMTNLWTLKPPLLGIHHLWRLIHLNQVLFTFFLH